MQLYATSAAAGQGPIRVECSGLIVVEGEGAASRRTDTRARCGVVGTSSCHRIVDAGKRRSGAAAGRPGFCIFVKETLVIQSIGCHYDISKRPLGLQLFAINTTPWFIGAILAWGPCHPTHTWHMLPQGSSAPLKLPSVGGGRRFGLSGAKPRKRIIFRASSARKILCGGGVSAKTSSFLCEK